MNKKLTYKELEDRIGLLESQLGQLNNQVNSGRTETNKKEGHSEPFSLLEQVHNGVITIDFNNTILSWNAYATTLYQWTKEEAIGQNIITLLSPEELKDEAYENIKSLNRDGHWEGDFDVKRKDGSIIPVHIVNTYLKDSSGENIGFVGISVDISERRRINKYLQEKNKELLIAKEKAEESDHLKSAFLANMSHEIRTPMNAILGFSHLLNRENLSNEKKEKYLTLINSGGKRLLNIISDIIDISKIDVHQLDIHKDSCHLNKLIDDLQNQLTINDSNTNCQIKISKGLSDAESDIWADESRLIQILTNLLENALKFTQKGSIEFGYTLEDQFLRFFVKDTGIGIDPIHHKVIFERFKQIDQEYLKSSSGTGLGLSIAKSLTELLGGTIWLDSTLGKGTTFYFTIPYARTSVTIDEKTKINSALNSDSKMTILIADDEYSNYLYLEELFKEHSFDVLHAKNGKEAIEMVSNNKSIDIVLMDIKMPIMNGLEAAKAIREINKKIPIIALTAYAMAKDKKMALESGCDHFYTKPIMENTLNEIIDKYKKPGSHTN